MTRTHLYFVRKKFFYRRFLSKTKPKPGHWSSHSILQKWLRFRSIEEKILFHSRWNFAIDKFMLCNNLSNCLLSTFRNIRSVLWKSRMCTPFILSFVEGNLLTKLPSYCQTFWCCITCIMTLVLPLSFKVENEGNQQSSSS